MNACQEAPCLQAPGPALRAPHPDRPPPPPQQTSFKGCCCEACQEAPRLLRPAKTRGLYGNWSEYAEGEAVGTGGTEERVALFRLFCQMVISGQVKPAETHGL